MLLEGASGDAGVHSGSLPFTEREEESEEDDFQLQKAHMSDFLRRQAYRLKFTG